MYFPVNFAKFLRTDFLQNTHGRFSPDLFLKGHSLKILQMKVNASVWVSNLTKLF